MIWAFVIPGVVLYFLCMGITYAGNFPAAYPHLRKYRIVKEEIEDDMTYHIEVLSVFGWRYLRAPKHEWSVFSDDVPIRFRSYEAAQEKIRLIRINKRTILPEKYEFGKTIEVQVEERNFKRIS
jgi:hypothetical protein